jgi:hypothetical protein
MNCRTLNRKTDDRRARSRLDLQLICRVGAGQVASTPVTPDSVLLSENISRAGILLRWLPEIPLPQIGSSLTVEVELPAAKGQIPKMMRCDTKIVRIQGAGGSQPKVALTIEKIRFEPRANVVPISELRKMTSPSRHLN